MARKQRRRGWGSGSIEELRSGWFRIRWRERDGKKKTARYQDQGDAEAILARIVVNVRAGKPSGHVAPAAPNAGRTISELGKDWLARRLKSHRNGEDDRNRWNKHIEPIVGHMKPGEVTQGTIRLLVEKKLEKKPDGKKGLSPQSVTNIVRLLSTFYSDAIEQGDATANPARALPKATRRLLKSTHDPVQTVFISRQADLQKVYAALAEPFATIFILGALTGMRPGEMIPLEWGDVDIVGRRITVQRAVRHSKVGPRKNGKALSVRIMPELLPILKAYRLATGGEGLLFKPLTSWRQGSRFIGDKLIRKTLTDTFKACGLPPGLTWYGASRHTWASQAVMSGASLYEVQRGLDHSSPAVTTRYAHLDPKQTRDDLVKLTVSLSREGGDVVDLAAARAQKAGQNGHEMDTAAVDAGEVRG